MHIIHTKIQIQRYDFMLSETQQPIFGATIVKYDEETHSHQRKIVISGFPYDQGTRRNGGRTGGSVAPKFFRQALNNVELYPKQKVLVVDSGDISPDEELEVAHKLLLEKHRCILGQGPETLLVSVGGSNDQSYPNVSALLSAYSGKKVAVINLDSHFDVRPLKEGKAHSGSPFRLMLEDEKFISSQSHFVEFGSKGATCSNVHYEYLKSKGAEVIWMEKDIRRHKAEPSSEWRTQAGQVFAALLERLSNQHQVIFVSFDVDVINSKWMPGVSAPSVIGGLTSEQAREIVLISGRQPQVRLVDFSEFNPAIESTVSSNLLAELVFWVSEGFGCRSGQE